MHQKIIIFRAFGATVLSPPTRCYRISHTRARVLIFRAFWGVSGKNPFFGQKRSKSGPRVVKNGQNCPQIGEIIGAGPQKIPTNPKNIGKMAKNAPTEQSENAPKRVKMAKNDQKSAKMAKKWENLYKKSIFSTTTSLKSHFLKEMHQNNIRLRRKKF